MSRLSEEDRRPGNSLTVDTASTSRASLSVKVTKWRAAAFAEVIDAVAVEEPLCIQVLYPDSKSPQTLAITMRTPGSDRELIAGFLFSEGVIECAEQILHFCQDAQNTCTVKLRDDVVRPARGLDRHFVTSSSCGACGKTDLGALLPVRLQGGRGRLALGFQSFAPEFIVQCVQQLSGFQEVFKTTGGTHGTGLFFPNPATNLVAEDVGRHNAFDKVLGQLLFSGTLAEAMGAVAVVSGRLSFELVQKAVMAAVPCIVAVGAPSSYAVRLADDLGLTVIGFARGQNFNVYTHKERIVGTGSDGGSTWKN